MVTKYPRVKKAILVLGHQPDDQGNIQEGVRRRADLALRLYEEAVAKVTKDASPEAAPVIIPSGWYWPKKPELARFPESHVIEKYMRPKTKAEIICEDHSTSIPENLLFTNVLFPNLDELTIVSGEEFMDRTKFLGERIFSTRIGVTYVPCKDRLSGRERQNQLLANVKCILKDMRPGSIHPFVITERDGKLRSNWTDLNQDHKTSCPIHGEGQAST